jgi:hypothetical protein
VRLSSVQNIKVGIEDSGITFRTIETDSVSSCHFILIDGKCDETPFAYLSHSAKIYEQNNAKKTLVELIEKIVRNINEYNTKNGNSHFKIIETTDLRLFVGGGVDDPNDMIRKAFSLLNDVNMNIQEELPKARKHRKACKHLLNNLQGKINILPTTTYLISDKDETQGK